MRYDLLSVFTTLLLKAALATFSPMSSGDDGASLMINLTFIGAAEAYFQMEVPVASGQHTIANELCISQIISEAPSGVSCVLLGRDGSATETLGSELVEVGPPQTQDLVSCWVALSDV